MQSEAGKKMQQCIEALCRMHGAVSKLLVDFDKCVACPSTSVFGNTATKDLTYATKAAFWMPEGVFRYLSCKDNPRIVEAVTACFVEPTLEEPVLLIGHLEYAEDPLQARAMCDGWDLWYLYFPFRADWVHGVPRTCTPPPDMASRIMTATLISYPLYSVSRMADVAEFLVSVRQVHQSAASKL